MASVRLCIAGIGLCAVASTATETARGAGFHHVQIIAPSPSEATAWYARHLDCAPVPDRNDAAACNGIELIFSAQATMGSTQGTGIDHIAFSYADVSAKMAALEAVGVRGSGVRLQRFDDGATLRDVPGLNKQGFLFDPWGTRIELVQDPNRLGFHHVHLSAADPARTLAWYARAFGGKPGKLGDSLTGVRFGDAWLFAAQHPAGKPAPTRGRAIAHIAFGLPNLGAEAARLSGSGIEFESPPEVPPNGRSDAKTARVRGPDEVTVMIVEPGFAGIDRSKGRQVTGSGSAPYRSPRTPWGAPDLQGVWTGNAAHGIPLERPAALEDVETLTEEQAAARRERGTLNSIWGYEREWRDTTLGYDKMRPSTQVAMIVDPPDGRLPAMTPEGERRAAEAQRERAERATRPPAGPEDLTPYVRCITRGLPGMMMAGIYNNGLQIAQGPGHVVILKEMIHEARTVPTRPRAEVGAALTSWLGDSQGRWEGDTLVIETKRFNGRSPFRGSSAEMALTERFTRVGPTKLLYEFTVDDPQVWTRPWTARFAFDLDDQQYELVEYACHEGNYGMFNILSGARARDKEAAQAAR